MADPSYLPDRFWRLFLDCFSLSETKLPLLNSVVVDLGEEPRGDRPSPLISGKKDRRRKESIHPLQSPPPPPPPPLTLAQVLDPATIQSFEIAFKGESRPELHYVVLFRVLKIHSTVCSAIRQLIQLTRGTTITTTQRPNLKKRNCYMKIVQTF